MNLLCQSQLSRVLILSFFISLIGCNPENPPTSPALEQPNAGEKIEASDQPDDGSDIVLGKNNTRVVEGFYEHVFKNVKDRARVAVYSQWDEPPAASFRGVHVFLDGESYGVSPKHRKNLDRMLYIGPRSDTGAKKSIYVPFISLHFAERRAATPLALLKPGTPKSKPFFAAYLVSNCSVAFREQLYDQLVELAQDSKLGEVHALGKCHGSHPETSKPLPKEDGRDSIDWEDSAVNVLKSYQFVLTSENVFVDGYVTEKPINALLAGAIPIYVGTRDILARNLLNPESFIFVLSPLSFKQQILDVVNDEAKKNAILSAAPVVSDEQLYNYSWHGDVAEVLANKQKGTLLDLIRSTLREMTVE